LSATAVVDNTEQLYIELWVSLASLLRSYTAAHGLNGNRQATVELGEATILVRHGDHWLDLERRGKAVNWKSSGGSVGTLEFTEDGRLLGAEAGLETNANAAAQEMDMVAESWAAQIMRETQS
jgi:hypothetical protein